MTSIHTEPPGDLRKKRRVCAKYNQGTLIKVRLKDSHHIGLADTQNLLEIVSGLEFSSTILIRRSLERYCKDIQQLGNEALQNEARHLLHYFR